MEEPRRSGAQSLLLLFLLLALAGPDLVAVLEVLPVRLRAPHLHRPLVAVLGLVADGEDRAAARPDPVAVPQVSLQGRPGDTDRPVRILLRLRAVADRDLLR